MAEKKQKLALIDGHSLIYRGFHALPELTTSKGELTNAVYGFTLTLLKTLEIIKPTHIAVSLDRKGPTFRHKLYKEYKGTRSETPLELLKQIPRVKEIINAFNMPIYSMKGYEADDFIGSIAKQSNIPVVIVTGDNDMLQLADKNVSVQTPKRGLSNPTLYNPEKVIQKYDGLTPEQLADYKGLAGDKSDNIPGVPGVGHKTAIDLLLKYETVEGIYEAIEKPDFEEKNKAEKIIRPKVLENLKKHKDDALLSKKLGTIVTDINTSFNLEDATLKDYDPNKVIDLFQELEFKQLITKIPEARKSIKSSTQKSLFDKKEETIFSLEEKNKENKVNYQLIRGENTQEVNTLIKKLNSAEIITIDTETTSLHPMEAELVGIGFCAKHNEAFYLTNPDKVEQIQLDEIKKILKDPKKKYIGHHLKYDLIVLKNHGFEISNSYFDTMLAAFILDPSSRRYKLDDLALQELSYKMMSYDELVGTGRTKKLITEVEIEKLVFYACEDVDLTYKIYTNLTNQIHKDADLLGLFNSIEMPLIECLMEMEMNGISIDEQKFKDLSKDFSKEIQKLIEEIYKMAGTDDFNINSTQQLSKVLFDKLKLPIKGIKKTQTGYSTASSELEKLRKKHPIISQIESYRELTKLKNTYIDTLPKLVNPKTNKIHTSFNQTGAATGRLSSTDPNLQNIPTRTEYGQKIRKAFIASKGNTLISADYSQIDLRVVAHISNDKEMITAFKNDEDIHTYTAARMFGKEKSEVTPDERNTAKMINFGIIYGMGAYGLSSRLGIDRHTAHDFITTYFEKYTGVKQYMDEAITSAHQNGYAKTLSGRKRYLPELKSKDNQIKSSGERIAINMPVQGSAADIIKIAMNNIHHKIQKEKLPYKMLVQIHDELIFEVQEKEVEKAEKMIKTEMENAFPLSIPLKVNIGNGDNWSDIK